MFRFFNSLSSSDRAKENGCRKAAHRPVRNERLRDKGTRFLTEDREKAG